MVIFTFQKKSVKKGAILLFFCKKEALKTSFAQLPDYGTHKLGSSKITVAHREKNLTVKSKLRYSQLI